MMMKAAAAAAAGMIDEENMSNLTSATAVSVVGHQASSTTIPPSSSTATSNTSHDVVIPASSSTPTPPDNISLYSQQQQPHQTQPFSGSGSPPPLPPPAKKKRNFPGNPDPDAEVIALSPKTLLATNRFVCEVCNKGFQRDQNLQLHRRGHNLPWKLKQRSNKEIIRKKVYVCPEPSCVHHEPSRALGDLTGIKKHFCRKHGEKKWKCDKCSKRYAVRSDWKAHSKICGTREYRCDCGTFFSRRDSFITHRAFCDALTEESTRSTATLPSVNPRFHHHSTTEAAVAGPSSTTSGQPPHNLSHFNHLIPTTLKTEQAESQNHYHQQNFNSITRLSNNLPPWLACPIQQSPSLDQDACPPPSSHIDLCSGHQNSSSQLFPSSSLLHDQNPNLINLSMSSSSSEFHGGITVSASPHMSATALLQKAAQMGVKMSNNNVNNNMTPFVSHQSQKQEGVIMRHYHPLMLPTEGVTGLMSSSSLDQAIGGNTSSSGHGLFITSGLFMGEGGCDGVSRGRGGQSVFHEVRSSFASSPSEFDGSSFEDAFGGIMMNHNDPTKSTHNGNESGGGGGGGNGSDRDGMTRDFLGLRSFSHKDLLSMVGLDQIRSSYEQQQQRQPQQHNNQSQRPWHG